jgi:hypothetical protein
MSVRTLRWSGWSLLIGSFVVVVISLLGLLHTGPNESMSIALLIVGATLAVLGFPAAYLKQAKQMGWLGLCGFLALFLGLALVGVLQNIVFRVSDTSEPSLLIILPGLLGGVLELLGGLLFGIMTVRAHVFPVATGWLLIIAGLSSFILFGPFSGAINVVGGTASQIMLYLAIGWMGYVLALRTKEGAAFSVA